MYLQLIPWRSSQSLDIMRTWIWLGLDVGNIACIEYKNFTSIGASEVVGDLVNKDEVAAVNVAASNDRACWKRRIKIYCTCLAACSIKWSLSNFILGYVGREFGLVLQVAAFFSEPKSLFRVAVVAQ